MVDETIATGLAASNAKHAGVYAIRNTVSGRVYVGSSQNIQRRWNAHRHQLRQGTHHAVILQRSWERHGEAAFVFVILERVDDLDTMWIREQHWIDLLKAHGGKDGCNGYPTAGSPRGHKWTDKQRVDAIASRTGRKLPPRTAEHSAAISVAKKAQGRKMTAEQLLAFSIMQTTWRRKPFSAAHRAALSASRMGTKASDETKLLQSLAKRGKRLSPQHAANVRANLAKRNKTVAMRLLTAARNKTPAMRLLTVTRNRTRKRILHPVAGQTELDI